MAIDLVYTWVNGDDPQYQAGLQKYAHTRADSNPERYRDNLNLLQFSLRSVAKNLPWIRQIYIVTQRPQIPAWLNTRSPKIRIVHHDAFFETQPDQCYLPTFSSNAIELQLHRIADLSENFIYMCDDFLLGQSIFPEDFMTPSGKIKIMPARFGNWHIPHLITRSLMTRMIAEKREYYAAVMANKFRHTDWFPLDHVYADFLITHNLHEFYSDAFARRHKRDIALGRHSMGQTESILNKITRFMPKFIAISDDLGIDPDSRYVDLIRQFLYRLFPQPSEFEQG